LGYLSNLGTHASQDRPITAAAEDLRSFQLHQAQTGVRSPSIKDSVAALHFFFTVTLD
jgi:integrase/recombinase XerD